ncbi:MAG: hypothetical protein GX607_10360, partial [Myxococcales bacterium]|nr:hypothetical protein [Myxococcales bacterium]
PLSGNTTVADLEQFYGIHLDADPSFTLARLLRERLGEDPTPGASAAFGRVVLSAREVIAGTAEQVGLTIEDESDQENRARWERPPA